MDKLLPENQFKIIRMSCMAVIRVTCGLFILSVIAWFAFAIWWVLEKTEIVTMLGFDNFISVNEDFQMALAFTPVGILISYIVALIFLAPLVAVVTSVDRRNIAVTDANLKHNS